MRVHHVDEGPSDGEVVVLSGSIGSDLRMWEPQVGPLTEAGYRVVRYDHRGHGRTPVPDGPCSLADLGGDVVELLDELGVERAHVVGVSLGGMTGLWLGAHRPERVRGLVVCCTSAKLGTPESWAARAQTARTEGMTAVADASIGRWFTDAWSRANPERARFYHRMTASVPAEGYAACCAAIGGMDLRDGLPGIIAPTLVVAGADDPATPPDEHGRPLAAAIPGARFELVEGAAHLGSVERPELFTHLILDHLRRTADASEE